MGAVAAVARAELRQRWRTLLLLGLLAGLAGGVAVGALAGARRTATAFERAVEVTQPGDITVRGFAPGVLQGVSSYPEVERSWSGRLSIGQLVGRPAVAYASILSGPLPPPGLFRPQVVAGRLPDPSRVDEVALSDGFARQLGVGTGDQLDLELLTDQDIARFGAFDEPGGAPVHLDVVGIVRVAGTASGEVVPILATPAYGAAHRGDGGADFVMAKLRHGAADVPAVRDRLDAALAAHPASTGSALPPFDLVTPQQEADAAARASRVVVTGLLLVAGVAVAAGVVAVVQATGLFAARRRVDQETLEALGLSRTQRIGAAAVPLAGCSAPVAAVVTLLVALAGSTLTPVGSAVDYEPTPGLELNWVICGVGALGVAAALVACAPLVASRRARRRPVQVRPSIADGLSRFGVRPPVAIGSRFALEPGSGRTAVPIRSTLVAAVIGVAGVVAALTYGGSFDRVIDEPVRYGYPADLEVVDVQDAQLAQLAARADVAALSDVHSITTHIGSIDATTLSFDDRKGTIAPTMLQGRRPATRDEVALGPAVAASAHARIGDAVSARSVGGTERTLSVVGIALMNGNTTDDYDRTALLTADGLDAFGDTPSRTGYVTFVPGTDVTAARSALAADAEVDGPRPPTPIRNVEQLDRLPVVLAGFFALIAAIALVNSVGTALARRRRDLAVLRALGFTPRQSGSVVLGMVTTTAVVGIIGGVPLGLLIGRVLWRTVAEGMDVAPAGVAPVAGIILAAFGALAVANLLGLAPAAVAARRAAATGLRAE